MAERISPQEPQPNRVRTPLREWMMPIGLVGVASTLVFLLTSIIDFGNSGNSHSFWEILFFSDSDSAHDDVGNLAEVLIGVLGLTLTVVAIVVQLAAQRYTPKLVDLFLADRVNIFTFLGMVFASVFCIWIIYSMRQDYVPIYGNLVLMGITTILLTMLIPYFRYVFRFLTPSNIIQTIQVNVSKTVHDSTMHTGNGGSVARQHARLLTWPFVGRSAVSMTRKKVLVANGLEQITDIALSAVTQTDRNVALMAINTLSAVLRDYMDAKPSLRSDWFKPNPSQFISISSEFFDEIKERQVWLEARGLMDLELIFGLALRTMPDANSAIAANTRQLALSAIAHQDAEAAYLCVEYFNTFLRRSINDKNQRAVFSLFYQYRRLAQALLRDHLSLAEEIVGFIDYYGQQAMRQGMPFLKVAATMDICAILQHGYGQHIEPMDKMLAVFLRIGESAELRDIPFAHEGVRKAHVILAAYLMEYQRLPEHLTKIQKSLQLEPKSWLEGVRKALLGVTKRKFWEITDRGGLNFEYIDPEQKQALSRFYKEYMHSPRGKPSSF